MRTIKTYPKVGAFYIACEADLSIPIPMERPFRFGCDSPKLDSRLDVVVHAEKVHRVVFIF